MIAFHRFPLALATVSLLVLSPACREAPAPDLLEPAPRVVSFTASAAEVAVGERVTLTWAVENAEALRIDELKLGSLSGVGNATGQVEVAITEDALFVLSARNARGASDTAVVAVRAREAARAGTVLFTALPRRIPSGGAATLGWSAPGARSVTLAAAPGGPLDVGTQVTAGSLAVSPTVSTVYTLTVDGKAFTAEVTVEPAILAFSGTPISAAFDAGTQGGSDGGTPTQPVTLAWQTVGGERVVLSAPARGTLFDSADAGDVTQGQFVDRLPASVDPSQLFSYRLTLSGSGAMVQRDLVLAVSGRPAVLTLTAPTYARRSTDGGTLALGWTTVETDELSIAAGGAEIYRAPGDRITAGTALVPVPDTDTTYVATARNARGGSASRSVTVDVVEAPTLTATATPAAAMAGQAVSVSWTGQHLREVKVRDPRGGVLFSARGVLDTGSVEVSVAQSTTLTVEAGNGLGETSSATVTITVANPFTLTQSPTGTLQADQDIDLSWTATGLAAGFAHGEVLVRTGSSGFDDISRTGTLVTFTNTSDGAASFEPGFRMPFFDRIVGERVWVSTNGYLSFASRLNGLNYLEAAFPNGRIEPYSIAGNWDDTNVSAGSVHWEVKPTASGQLLIVQWTNVGASTWQVKLYSTGQVDLEYLTYGGAGQAGIQGPRGDWGFPLPSARADAKGFTFFGPAPAPLRTRVKHARPLYGTLLLGNREMLVAHDPGLVVRPGGLSMGEALLAPATAVGAGGRWVELFNGLERPVDLSGWALSLPDGGSYPLSGSVPPGGTRVVGASADPSVNDDAGVQLALPGFDAWALDAGSLAVGRVGPSQSFAFGTPTAGTAQVIDVGPFRFSSETSLPARAQVCAATATFGGQAPAQKGTPGVATGCGFGYRLQEIAPGFFDIRRTGTVLTVASKDSAYAPVSLATAPFPFFGTPQADVRMSTNGFLTFDLTSTSNPGTVSGAPSTSNINSVIAPFWADLDGPNADSQLLYERVGQGVDPAAPAPHWVFQWHEWARWTSSTTSTDRFFFQAKLFDDGVIEFHFREMESGSSSQHGAGGNASTWVENAAGTQALVVNTQSTIPGISPNTAFRFIPR